MSDLYDEDILLWSERQAALLRRVASGERVNDPDLDWPNIIEEVESVGASELRSVQSLLIQALLHILKARAWPDSLAVPGWQAEARGFSDQARDRFTSSMQQRLDVDRLYAAALRRVPTAIDGKPALSVPSTCFVTLDQWLDPTMDIT